MRHVEKRWAISQKNSWGRRFLGRFFWPGATYDDPMIRTFTTRREAREAQKAVRHTTTRVERVTVIVEASR